ncbi:cysteinyl-tRNA synthetase [Lophium mytilinum]|uniref:cysteine--tRNA ligase n=1 Tax=Lophium mytilinum TaxID=390894 RepID=A0A6A6QXM4_9PEZI|nr:cysteinyl-tRNA synthetase [Lophium mytilinum]
MATTTRQQPPWQAPQPTSTPKLKVYNSLTRSKNDFVPLKEDGVTWYSCGPTVYDDAHLGHARNYVSIDILRRIVSNYFNYPLQFVQNVTDVDDKIILRGRQQHLLESFSSEHTTLDTEVVELATKAFNAYVQKNLPELPADLKPELFDLEANKTYKSVLAGKSLAGDNAPAGDTEAKVKMHLKTAGSAAGALVEAAKDSKALEVEEFYTQTQDALLPYLDSLYGSKIDASDHSIFTKLTQKYEARFMEDMRNLNVLEPDVITRVTEFGPQIIKYVEKILDNGFAYVTSDGSIYFDIKAFEGKPGNHYARLEPWNRNDQSLLADGEGALLKKSSEKKSDGDFAIWKASKPGEPSWPSPWGPGRPGWHIECSVMASDVLGANIDVHSGGIDLCFPHHDNELAQAEAYWSTGKPEGHQWIRYFLHMGHLSISGSKMSKSLKNFTTIRDALGTGDFNARGLRIIFLLGGWNQGVEITEGLRKQATSWERYLDNFFRKALDVQRHPTNNAATDQDTQLREALATAQSTLHNALSDSFDTPAAMIAIQKLVTEYNATDRTSVTDDTLIDVAKWITRIVRIFGLDGTADPYNSTLAWSGVEIPEAAKEFIYAASRERDEVRAHAIARDLSDETLNTIISKDTATKLQDAAAVPYAEVLTSFQESLKELAQRKADPKEFLDLCDKLRDISLWDLGIYLEDREGLHALVRPVDAELRAAREQKEERERAKKDAKAKREADEKEKAAKRLEAGKVSERDYFRTPEYSVWDEDGLPTKDAKGEELPKSKAKKLKKEWAQQKKLHEEWLASQG